MTGKFTSCWKDSPVKTGSSSTTPPSVLPILQHSSGGSGARDVDRVFWISRSMSPSSGVFAILATMCRLRKGLEISSPTKVCHRGELASAQPSLNWEGLESNQEHREMDSATGSRVWLVHRACLPGS